MIRAPRYKVCRQLGERIFPQCQTPKFSAKIQKKTAAGGKGGKRFGGKSDFGAQLLEKQRMRLTYGLNERQFSNLVKKAREEGVNATTRLYQMLESRLDNVLFRMGLATSRAAGRQMVSHGHIFVNGKRLNIPSYQIKPGDLVSIRKESVSKPLFTNLGEVFKEYQPPDWLKLDKNKFSAEVMESPILDSTLNPRLSSILEFYSR